MCYVLTRLILIRRSFSLPHFIEQIGYYNLKKLYCNTIIGPFERKSPWGFFNDNPVSA